MKILVACFLLSTLSLAFAHGFHSHTLQSYEYPQDLTSKESDEVGALLQTLADTEVDLDTEDDDDSVSLQGALKNVVGAENDEDTAEDDDGDDDIATLQGVFNVMAQLDEDNANLMRGKHATAQHILFHNWRFYTRKVFKLVKRGLIKYLNSKFCPKWKKVVPMPRKVDDKKKEMSDRNDNQDPKQGEEETFAQLQTVFDALRKLEATKEMEKDTTVNSAKFKGSLRKVKRFVRKNIRRIVKKYLCRPRYYTN